MVIAVLLIAALIVTALLALLAVFAWIITGQWWN
jgi:hypothetical protein